MMKLKKCQLEYSVLFFNADNTDTTRLKNEVSSYQTPRSDSAAVTGLDSTKTALRENNRL